MKTGGHAYRRQAGGPAGGQGKNEDNLKKEDDFKKEDDL